MSRVYFRETPVYSLLGLPGTEMKWIKMGSVILLVLICGAIWTKLASKPYLPLTKRLIAEEHRENIGFDSLNCIKVELSEIEYRDAIQKLRMTDKGSIPKAEASPANCSALWWNIDFPKEASVIKLGKNGETRELAAYVGGYFYYVSEIR
jgi:hypothetical protein